jgi:hypothetical protein
MEYFRKKHQIRKSKQAIIAGKINRIRYEIRQLDAEL